MLYADDVGVVSQSPEQLRKMIGVIVVVYATFGLTVSEAKIEIMCLCARGMPDLSIGVDRRIRNAWCSLRRYTLELYDRPSAPLEFKFRMRRAEVLETMLYGCVTWSPRAYHYDTLHRLAKTQSRRPPDFRSGHAYQDGK